MDLIIFMLGAAVGGFIGFKVAEYIHTTIFKDILMKLKVSEADMRSMLNELQKDLPEDHEDALPRVEVKVEKVNEQLYVYRLDNDEFLCQGADRADVLANLAKRFNKDFKIVLSEEHGAQYLKESPTS